MIVRLTSAAILHGVTEATAAHMIDLAQRHEPLQVGYWVDFHNHHAYLWKDGEMVADATL